MAARFRWHDRELKLLLDERIKDALGALGFMVEGAAKAELYEGHGVDTGALRASIHVAQPGYAWSGDNSSTVTERGGHQVRAVQSGERVVIEVGSGMEYAIWVHQGHHSFAGYHFLTNAVDKVRPRVPEVVQRFGLR